MPDAPKAGWVLMKGTHNGLTTPVLKSAFDERWSKVRVDGKQVWHLADDKADPAPTPQQVVDPAADDAAKPSGGKA